MKCSAPLPTGFCARAPIALLLVSGLLAAAGCAGQKAAPVGSVLEYDPANDPAMKAAEEYMQDPTAGMETESGGRP